MSTTQTAPKYTTGQPVEVLATDFNTPGFPQAWFPGTVTIVEARDGGLWDVQVRAENGTWHPQIIGKCGGNRRIRPVVA